MDTPHSESDQRASEVDKDLVSGNTRFALNILKELQKEDEGRNIFISPLSVSVALAMIYNGARGQTSDAIAKTLQINGIDLNTINQGFRDLMDSQLNADDRVSLRIGNSIWIRKSFEQSIKANFRDTLIKYFGSEILPRQFSDPGTVDEINSWAKKATEGKIDKIIENIPYDTMLFIINAIYFKGEWADKFDESRTRQRSFYLQNDEEILAPMMSKTERCRYYSDDIVQIIRLPYGRGKIAMYILLPEESTDLDSFVQGLEQDKLDNIMTKMRGIELELQIPKLKLEYGKKQLNNVLTGLGMGSAFSGESADLEGLASIKPDKLYISFVDHKAVVEVNEEGTEAAAVTSIGLRLTSISMTIPKFVVDRPYLFMIRDDRSGSIIFIGKIMNPTQYKSP